MSNQPLGTTEQGMLNHWSGAVGVTFFGPANLTVTRGSQHA